MNESYAPRARHEDLLVEGLNEETLVYDLRTHKAHCLNRTAALVWNRCDGKATVGEMARALEAEFHAPVSSEIVWLAIEGLGRARLLSDRLPRPAPQPAMTRRAVIKRIGLGAAFALPLVTSVIAPTTAEAGTCRAAGTSCHGHGQCCSKTCRGMPSAGVCA